MADFYDEPERAWDEYDWERFLQQQDSKTERYMELFEKYIDDPNRDQIIAQEMGWTHLLDQPSEEVEEIEFEPDFEVDDEGEEETQEVFESHPLYQNAFSLTVWIDQLFDEVPNAAASPVAFFPFSPGPFIKNRKAPRRRFAISPNTFASAPTILACAGSLIWLT